MQALIKRNKSLVLLLAATVFFATVLIVVVIWPAYQKPTNRTYESRFGYPALRRVLGQPAQIQTATAQWRNMVVRQLGEGRMTSMPIRVPIVPTDKIANVLVAEGEHVTKGQLLAELDTTLVQMRVESAKLMVESAQAELERVKLGSAYTLTQERPEREGINLEASKKQIVILRERHASMLSLFKQGATSRVQLLEVESKLAEAERDLQSSQLGLDVSSKGQPQSATIAENNLKQQQNLLRQRLVELEDYRVRAPADGVLESVLIHAGEYNQKAGEVAFVIASHLWFEAHLDQTAINKVNVGDHAEVQLEALPGEPVPGKITRLVPIVTYSTGGPESNRPVRALGTGTPEWPTTFSVIVEFSEANRRKLTPGLTGFARIESAHKALTVPAAAATIFSARQGTVAVLVDGKRIERKVTFGDQSEGWVEIMDGLGAEEVIALTREEIPDARPELIKRAAAL